MFCCKNNHLITGEVSIENLLPVHSSSSSSVNIGSNIDLLRQILLRLPVKSLLVFKSVSKKWFSLISEPVFIRNHFLQNHTSIPQLFVQKPSTFGNNVPEFEFIFLDGKVTTNSVPFQSLTFVNDPAGIKIEQSCNGLLCCSSSKSTSCRRAYYIYNPSTNQYKKIRGSIRERGFLWICSVSLAFDPLRSPHYEVVCIWRYDTNNYQIEIYSSKTSSWRVSGYPFPAPSDIFYTSGVFWNGSLHWISLRDSSLYFDINQELFKTMPMPPTVTDGCDRMRIEYFGECKGHLHLIAMYASSMTHLSILEMETDHSGWKTKYHVDLDALTIAYPDMIWDDMKVLESLNCSKFSVLLVKDDEENESSSLVLQVANKIISYNLNEMSFKKIYDLSSGLHGKSSIKYRWFDAYQYIETLARV